MAAFTVFTRKVGEEGQDLEVKPETTVGEIKAQQGLKGYALYFKGRWKDSAKMKDLGIQSGDIISACKTGYKPGQRAGKKLEKCKGGRAADCREQPAKKTRGQEASLHAVGREPILGWFLVWINFMRSTKR